MSDMGIAFELLGVGMITVFVILSFVVVLGNLIIRFINRFVPEITNVSARMEEVVKTEIHPRKRAVIVSTVKNVTNNTGRVTKIEKM